MVLGRGDGLERHKGRIRMHIRKIFFMKRVIKHQIVSPSLEIFKK